MSGFTCALAIPLGISYAVPVYGCVSLEDSSRYNVSILDVSYHEVSITDLSRYDASLSDIACPN